VKRSEGFQYGLRTGRRAPEEDRRTVVLDSALDVEKVVSTLPADHFADRSRRSPISDSIMGNGQFGDCVFAADAKSFKRDERFETLSTFEEALTDFHVIDAYKRKTGCMSPGDQNDVGYSMLGRQVERRTEGWTLPFAQLGVSKPHAYKTQLFGSVTVEIDALRSIVYTLHGTQLGIDLPLTALDQLRAGQPWSYVPNSSRNRPGSWGGHAVYSNCWQAGGDRIACFTWAMGDLVLPGAGGVPTRMQTMTRSFVEAYVDEAWAHVSALDRAKRVGYNVDALLAKLRAEGVDVE
jgi:hypothetical protein